MTLKFLVPVEIASLKHCKLLKKRKILYDQNCDNAPLKCKKKKFTLCEVSDNSCHSSSYFVACDEHFFGINCSQKCDKSCVNKTCLHETGECQSPHKVHFLNISMFLPISINFTGFVKTPYFRLYYNMVYLIIMLHDGEKKIGGKKRF